MIARARIRLPFLIPIAQTAIATPKRVLWKGRPVVLHPMSQAEELDATRLYMSRRPDRDESERSTKTRTIAVPVAGVALNDQAVVMCNVLTVDFLEVEYARPIEDATRDSTEAYFTNGKPSVTELFELVNAWLRSLREKSGLAVIHEIDASRDTWLIEYLDDKGQTLPVEEGKFRKVQSYMGNLPWGAIFEPSFDASTHGLESEGRTPWDQLMLEAVDQLPAIGPAVVLAFAAFEQLVNTVITSLLPKDTPSKVRRRILSNKRSSPVERADETLEEVS